MSTCVVNDMKLIGGEFELRAEDLAIDPDARAALPGFGAPCEMWLDTGRSALAVVACELLRRGGRRKVWIPAYCCDSVVTPFVRHGFDVSYYRVGSDLRDVSCLPADGDTFVFIHYFGWRNRKALAAVGALRDRGVQVVEDCAQAGLTSGVGTHGDFAISSMRKLLPQPDGALLGSRLPLDCATTASNEEFIAAKVLGKLLRGSSGADDSYLRLFAHAESLLDPDEPREMSWLSRGLMRMTDLARASIRRRANWTTLCDALRETTEISGLRPLSDALDEGEVPLGLPVRIPRDQRDALRRHLASERIYCSVHWTLGHVPEGDFAEERALSTSLLTFPVDQRYGTSDMERLVGALRSYPGDLR